MAVKKGREYEVDIADMAFGGRGLAKVDGMVVFVDQTVTGDRVRARVYRKKKQYAEAWVAEMLTPSPFRVSPPCPYSGYCGGCKWQFVDYEQQLVFKEQQVRDTLAHVGNIRDVNVLPIMPSDPVFGYRNKMEFSCASRRWLMPHELGDKSISIDFALGLHVPGTFHKVLDIDACLLQPDTGNTILRTVKDHIKRSDRPPYGLRDHKGFWRFLMLRHSVAMDKWLVNLITSAEDRDAVLPVAEAVMDAYPDDFAGIVNNVTSRKAAIAVGESETLLAGSPHITDRIGRFEFRISANSFFQTNTSGAERLYGIARQFAALSGGESLLDLYCGTGTIALYLSDAVRRVTGIEIVESAIADARRNAEINGVDNCRFIQGDMREVLPGLEETPDVMVIDPPRAGMHKDVVAQVLDMAPEKIVYVSCNPSTLARDLAMLAEVYHVDRVQPVDLFPHTFHIESVARLTRTG